MRRDLELLLVEDNPNDAQFSLEALWREFAPGRTVHLEDGAAALDLIFGEGGIAAGGCAALRLVVLDLKLPKLDGIDVLRRLKQDERTRGIPVVMLTSSKEARDVAACYAAGANSYLVKPVAYEEYLKTVSEAARYWARLNVPPVHA